jgi:hypothetical protein
MMLAAVLVFWASPQQGEDLVGLGLRYLARHQAPTGAWGRRQASCDCPAEPPPPDPAVPAALVARIDALIAGLDDDDFRRRDQALADLIDIGPPAQPRLRSAAADGSAEAQWRAKRALRRIGVLETSEDVEATSMALLAFLGAGYTQLARPVSDGTDFGKVVKEGLQWLLAQEGPDGSFEGANAAAQAWGALALAEAYGMTASAPLKEPAQKAIDYIVAHPAMNARTLFYQGMALKSAELSELPFPGAASERTVRALAAKRADEPASIFIRAATQVLQIFTYKTKQRVDLSAALPGIDPCRMEMETVYAVGLAMFQADGPSGPAWKAYHERLREWIVPGQDHVSGKCERGTWAAEGTRARIRTSALATLSCEFYYR